MKLECKQNTKEIFYWGKNCTLQQRFNCTKGEENKLESNNYNVKFGNLNAHLSPQKMLNETKQKYYMSKLTSRAFFYSLRKLYA